MYNDFMIVLIVSKGKIFSPYANSLKIQFSKNNISAFIVEDYFTDLIFKSCDLIIVINPLMHKNIPFNKDKIYFAIQTEEVSIDLTYSFRNGPYHLYSLRKKMNNYNIIFSWSRSACLFLKRFTSKSVFLPYELEQSIDNNKNFIPLQNRKYDVIFIGWPTGENNRRAKILKSISDKYLVFPNSELWDNEKFDAILNSKIVLNIHFENSLGFEAPRFFEAAISKSVILSESVLDPYPFEQSISFESFNHLNLNSKIELLLKNNEYSNKLITNAFQTVSLLTGKTWEKIYDYYLLEKKIQSNKNVKLVKKLSSKNYIYLIIYIFIDRFHGFLKKIIGNIF